MSFLTIVGAILPDSAYWLLSVRQIHISTKLGVSIQYWLTRSDTSFEETKRYWERRGVFDLYE